jgi:hypothetical protein
MILKEGKIDDIYNNYIDNNDITDNILTAIELGQQKTDQFFCKHKCYDIVLCNNIYYTFNNDTGLYSI